MDSNDLDDLLRQLRSAAGTIRTLYRDLTDEDLDVESAMRHYPLLALGLAAGAGAAAGWWLGRKRQPELPPPPPEPAPKRPLEYVEELLPGAVDRVRARLPEVVLSDAAKTRARAWLGNIVEHQPLGGRRRHAAGFSLPPCHPACGQGSRSPARRSRRTRRGQDPFPGVANRRHEIVVWGACRPTICELSREWLTSDHFHGMMQPIWQRAHPIDGLAAALPHLRSSRVPTSVPLTLPPPFLFLNPRGLV